jgi:GDP-4-dehydro-6-deoxy-D-mannose reductase
VVAVASGELYGAPEALPVAEAAPLRPQNPYAVSKASADLLAGFYADAHGLRVIRPRAFNHAGPGQEPSYAIASFARQAARPAERGEDPIVFRTGNAGHAPRLHRRARRRARLPAARRARGARDLQRLLGRSTSARELLELLGRAAGAGSTTRSTRRSCARTR